MNTKNAKTLRDLVAHIECVREYENGVAKLFGTYPDGGLYSAIEEMITAYTELVAETIGTDLELLEWFLYDNECGAKGLQAGIDNNMTEITSVEDFLQFISLVFPLERNN